MECPLVDPCVFLCMAQLIIGDFLIGFFHRCLLGAVCTSEKQKKKQVRLKHRTSPTEGIRGRFAL